MPAEPPSFERLAPPADGHRITCEGGQLRVPDDPIVPYIRGDGTGVDIWPAAQHVIDSAVTRAYSGRRRIVWLRAYAGLDALQEYGRDAVLPADTVRAIQHYLVAIKGPLTTPVGGHDYVCLECALEQNGNGGGAPARCAGCGSEWVTARFRSLNVTLRQVLDLYACVRPVRWFRGVPSPVKHPEKLDVVIFRENTEDVYAGIEFASGSAEAAELIALVSRHTGKTVRADSGMGVKPISTSGTKRLVRKALQHAISQGRRTVTLVHKGNIMKFTEGVDEKKRVFIPRKDGEPLYIQDCICDAFLQNILLKPEAYDVIATLNLNGDYVSDALAAEVGGIGIAPGANINYQSGYALFEATHGTAPDIAGKDLVNPLSLVLSAVMMLQYLGWDEAAAMIRSAVGKAIEEGSVTSDFYQAMIKEGRNSILLGTQAFGRKLVALL